MISYSTMPSPAILRPAAIPSSSILVFVIFVSSTNSVSLATDVLVAPESTIRLMDRQLKLVSPMTEDARFKKVLYRFKFCCVCVCSSTICSEELSVAREDVTSQGVFGLTGEDVVVQKAFGVNELERVESDVGLTGMQNADCKSKSDA